MCLAYVWPWGHQSLKDKTRKNGHTPLSFYFSIYFLSLSLASIGFLLPRQHLPPAQVYGDSGLCLGPCDPAFSLIYPIYT